MELELLKELLELDENAGELFLAFLQFSGESLDRIGHLARLEQQVAEPMLKDLVERELVVSSRLADGRRVYSLAAQELIEAKARQALAARGGAPDLLDLELSVMAEVRELQQRLFITVISPREMTGSQRPPAPVREYLKTVFPYLDIRVGTRCNLNCLYCLLGHEKKMIRSREDLLREMRLGRQAGLERISFTGGEPTLHPDLFWLLKQAREHGYQMVILVTNASLLAENQNVERLVDAGVDSFALSLDTCDADTAARIWRRPLFDQVVKGIQNLVAHDELILTTTAVVNRLNYRGLPDLCRFLAELTRERRGMFMPNVDFVMPEENAWTHRGEVVCRLREAAPFVAEAIEAAAGHGLQLTHRGFPPCILKGYEELDMDRYMSIFQVHEEKEGGYRYHRTGLDLFRKKPVQCARCLHRRTCVGVYRAYAHLYGTDELVPVSRD